MKTGDLSKQFGVSQTTITRWIDTFEEFFSKGARRIETKQRTYNEEDILILATIATLSIEGLPHVDIRQRLKNGERVEHPGIANFGVDVRMVPAATVEQVIDSTEIRIELEQIKAERDKLADLLANAQLNLRQVQERLDKVESERREELMRWEAQRREEINQLKDEIAQLQHRLGRAEGELNYRRELDEKRQKPSE